MLSDFFRTVSFPLCICAALFLSTTQAAELELAKYHGRFSFSKEEVIIQQLCDRIPGLEQYYVDIGAHDGVGWSNTARLALAGWAGFAIEGDRNLVAKFSETYRNIPNVKVVHTFATPLNVCELLKSQNVPHNFGVLSIDIDSYDYFVLEALLKEFRPAIIVSEINEKIPPPLEFTVMFEEGWEWDYSQFYGQSISQLHKLCKKEEYGIVAMEYNNVILIDKEFFSGPFLSPEEALYQGYLGRQDHLKLFPWNEEYEWLHRTSPEEAKSFIHQLFAPYSGKYQLELPEDSEASS